ncbi:alginate lyase family protein [Streptomyces sp. NBRC 109706]|uniref:alginate lyase family protein n=1 Tax=Streptomyces sp. NBRC 109706 TaxID=1550035 RepID=UPI0007865996|nr:alginate lyase family protein [Streptomyces sp. NBRC 109706]
MFNRPASSAPSTVHRRWLLGVFALVSALLVGLLQVSTGNAAEADRAEAGSTATADDVHQFAPASFTHPGVLVSRPQLDFVRARVQAGEQPWANAFNQMMASPFADQSRTPRPRAIVECGSYSNPNHGCTDEREDAIAAYTNALAWYITQDAQYARKAIQLMDAWSGVIQDHTNSNAPLQTGWAGASWARAAELIKHTYGDWPGAGAFGNMLRNVYLPKIIGGSNSNGNWELTMMEAAVGIAVFLDDPGAYDQAMGRFMNRVPAFIYLESDGDLPRTVPGSGLNTPQQIINYWHGQNTFVNGVTQETCRDFTHTGYGLASIAHVAETSRIQGQDLYTGHIGERLRHGLGLQATYERQQPPGWLCGGSVQRGLGPVTEVGFNAMGNRLGHAMTNTQAYTESTRPQGSNWLFVAWGTLTHANQPN